MAMEETNKSLKNYLLNYVDYDIILLALHINIWFYDNKTYIFMPLKIYGGKIYGIQQQNHNHKEII